MAMSSDYVYRNGYYWKVDGTGPYGYIGGQYQALWLYPAAATAPVLEDRNFFQQNTVGPVTEY